MAIVAPIPDRARLEQFDQELVESTRKLREQFAGIEEPIDPAHAKRLWDTAKRLAIRLSENLPTDLDPEVLAEIRRIILEGLSVLDHLDEDRPLDLLDDFLVRAEAIRHYVRDALDEDIGPDESDPAALVALLNEWLPRVSQVDIAWLAGVHPRTVQRWKEKPGAAPRRLTIVARLVALLRLSWTPEGVIAWFDRPQPLLNNERPIDLLDEPTREQDLINLVRQSRAQHGS